MPPPTTTTSYCFIAFELREIALGCGNTLEHTSSGASRALMSANGDRHPVDSAPSASRFALFLELQHGRARGDFDFAVDDGALGDGDGARADPAAYHRGIAYFQLIPDG